MSFLTALPAFAQNTSNVVSAPTNTAATSLYKRKKTSSGSDFKTALGLQAISQAYSSPSAIDNGFTQQFDVTLKMRKQGEIFSQAELTLGSFTAANTFYYMLPEAYIGYGSFSGNSVTFGRKIENLSFADDFLNLGLVQPQATHDTINFERQGLVSLAGHFATEGFGLNAGYNPIFLPNQGPQATAKDGKIQSTSRWAPTPPDQFRFIDQNQEIIYAINDYDIVDVISHSGFYANVYFGQNKKRPVLNLTYARKPLNEIALARDTFADINTYQGNVLLTPVVLMHDVVTADLSLDSGNFKSTFSLLGDRPENKPAPEPQQAMQNLSPINIASVYMSYDFSGVAQRQLEFYAAYAQISGGEIEDINGDGQKSSFSFASSRTRFKKPFTGGAKADLFYINRRPLKADVKWIYDQQYRGSLVSARFSYSPSNSLHLNMGVDVLGVEGSEPGSTQTNYLQQNQANDRISAGVGYVF